MIFMFQQLSSTDREVKMKYKVILEFDDVWDTEDIETLMYETMVTNFCRLVDIEEVEK